MKSEYYSSVREQIKDGDLFLSKGSSFISKAILYFDESRYSHVGMVKWMGDRLWAIDMWYYGIEVVPLSRRILAQKEFCIVRPKNKTEEQLNEGLEKVLGKVETYAKYDYFLLPRIALYKKTGINLGALGERSRFVCSELAQFYTNSLQIRSYEDIELITPYDFIRFATTDEVEILFDNTINT